MIPVLDPVFRYARYARRWTFWVLCCSSCPLTSPDPSLSESEVGSRKVRRVRRDDPSDLRWATAEWKLGSRHCVPLCRVAGRACRWLSLEGGSGP
jgi:hypothetical protein